MTVYNNSISNNITSNTSIYGAGNTAQVLRRQISMGQFIMLMVVVAVLGGLGLTYVGRKTFAKVVVVSCIGLVGLAFVGSMAMPALINKGKKTVNDYTVEHFGGYKVFDEATSDEVYTDTHTETPSIEGFK